MATPSDLLAGLQGLRAGLRSRLRATSGGPAGVGMDMVLLAGICSIGTTSSGLETGLVLMFSKRAEARTDDATGVLVSARAKISAVKSMSSLRSSAESDVLSACLLTVDS
jgi:hypothetical protein